MCITPGWIDFWQQDFFCSTCPSWILNCPQAPYTGWPVGAETEKSRQQARCSWNVLTGFVFLENSSNLLFYQYFIILEHSVHFAHDAISFFFLPLLHIIYIMYIFSDLDIFSLSTQVCYGEIHSHAVQRRAGSYNTVLQGKHPHITSQTHTFGNRQHTVSHLEGKLHFEIQTFFVWVLLPSWHTELFSACCVGKDGLSSLLWLNQWRPNVQ